MNRFVTISIISAILLIAGPVGNADAVVYCKTVGVPKGCVMRPGTPGAGAPGVGVAPGVGAGAPGVGVAPGPGTAAGPDAGAPGAGVNRGGPANRPGLR